jgi:PhnB protein
MATINPYLNFNGTTEAAFNFYRSVFGGEFAMVQRFGDAPPDQSSTSDDSKLIMHIALPIGPHTVLMGSDVPGTIPPVSQGTNFAVSVSTDSKEEADRIFNNLSAGGNITMPIDHMFWGSYFGMLTDKFDIQWMVSFDSKFPNQ